uniref:Uncharacterized protein n=1 Tax=Megaselia scalaris TaxID=36166 RepID=T1GYA0_MEGSC
MEHTKTGCKSFEFKPHTGFNLNEEVYRYKSTFLNDKNLQTTEPKSSQKDYASNLQKLKKLVMVKFTDDSIVQSRESFWLEFYKSGQDKEIFAFNQNMVFGLKKMYVDGRLVFL